MAGKSLGNRKQLAQRLKNKHGGKTYTWERSIEKVLSEIVSMLSESKVVEGEKAQLVLTNFGVFSVTRNKPRKYHNVMTGEMSENISHKQISFYPSPCLKWEVRKNEDNDQKNNS